MINQKVARQNAWIIPRAQGLLATPAESDLRTRAWSELTIAFHHLFFTTRPLKACQWIAAAHYFTDNLADAIRYLYEALETLRLADPSPQLPTLMSNLAAALITVRDYEPARELAEAALAELARFNNPQIVMFARSNFAEALVGVGDHARALATMDAMMADVPAAPRRSSQNHYAAIAAEIYDRHGRIGEAMQCAETARAILADFPGGFNEVHSR